ncbi:hypothetical protein EDB92DRAFT_521826 [Lactarius akahatsu]|uniref:Uncharacterized protein n=1 Tax=Lactarius akahatsu TaxID=416441 RepID=A0AAD4LHB0_9AGAM|nr:hypothetical protein EDB92DRAFT_521826 [Lactarius akahatsu]
MPTSDRSPSSRPPSPSPMLPMKRKASQSPDTQEDLDSVPSSSKDFESGRVTCEDCGESVSYRDERSGAFTTKHWDTHKLGCPAQSSAPPAPEPAQARPNPSGPSAETISAGPPSKRRRAKRSEEERIQYLRSDPYVAQFEPYRVRCASCDKWIRLRPNSTYCSIPWDAHRKSCLARKGPRDPPPRFVAADPDVRKYDGERVLCKACNSWISVGPEGQAAQAWSQHRAQCRPASPAAPPPPASVASAATAPSVPSVPPPPQHQLALVSALPRPAGRAIKEKENEMEIEVANDRQHSPPASSPLPPPSAPQLSDTPSSASGPNAGTGSESRRRNAEQRAALLRSDPLLAQVEPHRVFCALCRKWVQLRQDSTFCAYPWQQHRSKCVIRHAKKTKTTAVDSATHNGPASPDSGEESTDNGELGTECGEPDRAPTLTATAMTATTTEDPDAGPDAAHSADNQAPRFADLDSPADRLTFTRHSIVYLFRTTYTPADALTIAALVAFMNAALPPDRHEEFDTAEVTRAAKTLHDRGRVAFEGDTLKLLHH